MQGTLVQPGQEKGEDGLPFTPVCASSVAPVVSTILGLRLQAVACMHGGAGCEGSRLNVAHWPQLSSQLASAHSCALPRLPALALQPSGSTTARRPLTDG